MKQVSIGGGASIEIVRQAEERKIHDTYLCREPRKTLYLVRGLGDSFYANGFDELAKKISEKQESKKPWYKRIFGA